MARHKREQDHYAKRAKKEGHAARSIYKLEEIAKRWKIFRRGAAVLDLGCSPGSWMQLAAKEVGERGRVIGYDLKPVNAALPSYAVARVGDVYEISLEDAEGPFDVVLSDMAPATMGDHGTDAARSASLAEAALAIASRMLRPGGNVVVKILEGRDVPDIVKQMRVDYAKVERLRPKATRKVSSELFLIGLGRRTVAPPADDGQ